MSVATVTANEAPDITAIVQIIHDCRFDFNEIQFDTKVSNLSIPFYKEVQARRTTEKRFWFFYENRISVTKHILRINDVDKFEIREGTQKGPGSEDYFNTIAYDAEQKLLWIRTVISKGIAVRVKSLNLSVENTHEVVTERTKLSLRRGHRGTRS
jgi:hypothetical protein